MSDKPRIPLMEMLREIDRELAVRRSVYPKWVSEGKLSKQTAERRIEVMEGIHERIKTLWHLEEISLEMRGDFE